MTFAREWFEKYGKEHDWPPPPGGFGPRWSWCWFIGAMLVVIPFWLTLAPTHPGWYQDRDEMNGRIYASDLRFVESGQWLLDHHFLGPMR